MTTLGQYDFPLDRFQREAIEAIDAGRTVLVAAPTGSGKTVVAEAAVAAALREGGRAFYTAPIKALSNQKFNDLVEALGAESVGLLTGDHAINPDAPVVVMTTEVLRNMVYAASDALDDLRWVVLDEVHFLQDTYRGPVWEEVLIHLPQQVRFVCLSATVSNLGELGDWIETLRGPTTVVVETSRPVDLHPLLMVADRYSERELLVPLVVDGRPNPEGHRFDADRAPRGADRSRGGDRTGGSRRTPRSRSPWVTPRRLEVVTRLEEEEFLPAIYFVFSRKGCDEAAAACVAAGLRFTTPEERRAIRAIADRRCRNVAPADLDALGYDVWLHRLECGFAAHHAGMVPAFREAVEECFSAGLVKVVFATETLALGINMPARAVVIERLTKYTGDGHELLTAAQFTQLTGRAGRRGIDEVGYAVVLYSPFLDFDTVAGLAASRQFPLTSAFRPTYNMTANLVSRYGRERAEAVLGRSFAQFQADRSLTKARIRLDRQAEQVGRLEVDATCDRGDAGEYLGLVEMLGRLRREQRGSARAEVAASLDRLRPGDVVERDGRLMVVLASARRRPDSVKLTLVEADGRARTFDGTELEAPLPALTRIELPVPYLPKDRRYIAECGRLLSRVNRRRLDQRRGRTGGGGRSGPPRGALDEARVLVESHPVHRCRDRDRHVAAARRLERMRREGSDLERRLQRARTSLPARFDAVIDLLAERGYLVGWTLTERGERLRRIFHEADLLVSLALESGLFDGLDPADLAALASCLTYEHRRADAPTPPVFPTTELRDRVRRLEGMSRDLGRAERARSLPITRGVEPGFVEAAHGWAAGGELDDVLHDDLSGGDFVRNVKVLIDLLGQIATVTPSPSTRVAARTAAGRLRRGVVAVSGALDESDEPAAAAEPERDDEPAAPDSGSGGR